MPDAFLLEDRSLLYFGSDLSPDSCHFYAMSSSYWQRATRFSMTECVSFSCLWIIPWKCSTSSSCWLANSVFRELSSLACSFRDFSHLDLSSSRSFACSLAAGSIDDVLSLYSLAVADLLTSL